VRIVTGTEIGLASLTAAAVVGASRFVLVMGSGEGVVGILTARPPHQDGEGCWNGGR
jgi:hypothetical protein